MGLALLLVILKTLYLRRGDETYNKALRFWGKIFAITFVMGVVTGIPMEFQFGTNWAAFSAFAGDIIAQTLAMEGAFAFFLESAFLGIFLFGEQRFGQKVHWFSALMVFLGTWASAYFILARRDEHYGRMFVRVGLVAAVISSVWMLFPTGHLSSEQVAEKQPVALAAMEGLFESERQAGVVLIGQPDVENRRIDNPIVIPAALSYLIYQSWNAEVAGLEAFPEEDWPDNIPLLYYSYHVMVGLGTIFIAITVVATFLLWRRKLLESRWMLWILMLATPFPFIANTAGWLTAELGRQPWLVYGLLRTSEGASPLVSSGNVLFTLIGFAGMYLAIGLLYFVLMVREVAHGPEAQGESLT